MAIDYSNKKHNKKTTRINSRIRVPEVRLVDQNGDNIGVVDTTRAMEMAQELDLDLVEISPDAKPPLCKLMNYGKYKYNMQKKNASAKKNQKTTQLKELKIRHVTDDHDYNIKMKKAKEFLSGGNKVKFSMRFRGREISHSSIGFKMFERIKIDLLADDLGKVETAAKMDGRQILMIISPNKA